MAAGCLSNDGRQNSFPPSLCTGVMSVSTFQGKRDPEDASKVTDCLTLK